MIVARSHLWLWVRRVRGDNFFWGPGPTVHQWKVEPRQASPAGRRSMEVIELLQKTLQRQRGKNTLTLLSYHLPTSHQCTRCLNPDGTWTREMKAVTATLHRAEHEKGDDRSESRKTQDSHSGYIQLRRKDTQKPDCDNVLSLFLALSLIQLRYYYNLCLYDIISQLTWNLGDKRKRLIITLHPQPKW